MALQRLLYRLAFWCRSLLRRGQLDRELDDEIKYHVEAKTEENLAKGMTPEEARRAARLELGGVEQVKEAVREARVGTWFDTLLQDLRFELRMLSKSPAFTAVAVLTLALGIGASTALFSVIDSLVFRDLPVHDPARLVSIYTTDRNGQWAGVTALQIAELEQQQTVFTGIFGRNYPNDSDAEVHGEIWPINLGRVTGQYYSVLGLRPALGRLISPFDVGISEGTASAVAVISYEFWQERYAGNPDVIGKTILIAQKPFSIIGVAPKGFFGEEVGFTVDVAVPITEMPGVQPNSPNALFCQYAAARLRNGVTLDQARAQLETIWPRVRAAAIPSGLNAEQIADAEAKQLRVEQYPANGFSYLRDQYSKPLFVLIAISGFILLIACLNLAVLLLARFSARRHEIAIRLALGASRWRIVRQSLLESLVISISGGCIGVALAIFGSRWLVNFWRRIPFNPPTVVDLNPGFRVLVSATSAAILTGVLFGLLPAWHASGETPEGPLHEGWRTPGKHVRRIGKLLITAQIAFSLVVVTAGGLLLRSLEDVYNAPFGFDYHHVAVVQLQGDSGPDMDYGHAYYRTLLSRISELPGVQSVALSQMIPGAGFGGGDTVRTSDTQRSVPGNVDTHAISPGYFETLKIPFVRGRDFTWQDDERAPKVAILSKSLANRLFPSGDSIGKYIIRGTGTGQRLIRVVGVVNDARLRDLRSSSTFAVFTPFVQERKYWTNVEIRTAGPSALVLHAAQNQAEALGNQFVFNAESLKSVIAAATANERAMAFVSASFSALALLIAVIGIEGLMSYTVTQRTREIGVRMALGAQRREILRTVAWEGVVLGIAGIAFGIVGALGVTHLMASLLYGVSAADPLAFAGAAVILLAVALFASFIPARRATRIDPMAALRHE